MKKISIIITIWLSFSALVIFVIFSWPWLLLHNRIDSLPNPPQPSITYGEFPFRLEYELNGQRKVIQDTLICEFDGTGWDEGQGKYRKWKGYLASGKERLLLLEVDNPVALRSDGKVVKQEIYYSVGSARYYMGDMKEYEKYKQSFPDASYFEQYEDGSTSSGVIQSDELLRKYNIKLISWDYTQPIKNNFVASKK
ncbi:hypothetical protein [Paenibacillus sp. FSL W8-0194]|uniref:hypothetical protein n=1 Tax=Paenibacillus sp. FSL W8-0194 TaxID=2921711 RepID=UPI0030D98917